MIQTVQILIIAKQRSSRQSLRALLNTWPAAGSIREAENCQSALQLCQSAKPDLVILDLHQPELNDLEIAHQIKSLWPPVKVVCLSMYPDALSQAHLAGADLCFSKSDSPEALLNSLETIILPTKPLLKA